MARMQDELRARPHCKCTPCFYLWIHNKYTITREC
jgi:hypothetical protein